VHLYHAREVVVRPAVEPFQHEFLGAIVLDYNGHHDVGHILHHELAGHQQRYPESEYLGKSDNKQSIYDVAYVLQ
jgi:hypothetical protein